MVEVKSETLGAVGIIGSGRLGSVLARVFAQEVYSDPKQVVVYDRNREKLVGLAQETGVSIVSTLSELAARVELIILAVKPKDICDVLRELSLIPVDLFRASLVISVAAGVRISTIRRTLSHQCSLARVMPNVASLVKCGMSGVFAEELKNQKLLERMFSSVGAALVVNREEDLDVVCAVAGSGPAFIFNVIEALANGAVQSGMSWEDALVLSTETVFGSAMMVRHTGTHPKELCAMVASPQGTTVAGLAVLEKAGFKGTIIAAVEASVKRGREIAEMIEKTP